jgi:23S rRNA (adenine1618-N6)-methyltransferase
MENVWSRHARRKRQGQREEMVNQPEKYTRDEAAIGVRIHLMGDDYIAKGVTVVIRWLKGTDTILFESFCGMMKQKIQGS